MKVSLDVQRRLECMLAGIPILRMLKKFDRKMAYQEFAKEIGLMGRAESWQQQHRQQVASILYGIAAIDDQANGEKRSLDYERIVNAATGEAGSGAFKRVRIVKSDE